MQNIVNLYPFAYSPLLPPGFPTLAFEVNQFNDAPNIALWPTDMGVIANKYFRYYGANRAQRTTNMMNTYNAINDVYYIPNIPPGRRIGTIMTIKSQTFYTVSTLHPEESLYHDIYIPMFLLGDDPNIEIDYLLRYWDQVNQRDDEEQEDYQDQENTNQIREEENTNQIRENTNQRIPLEGNLTTKIQKSLFILIIIYQVYRNFICCSCPDFQYRVNRRPCKHMRMFHRDYGINFKNELNDELLQHVQITMSKMLDTDDVLNVLENTYQQNQNDTDQINPLRRRGRGRGGNQIGGRGRGGNQIGGRGNQNNINQNNINQNNINQQGNQTDLEIFFQNLDKQGFADPFDNTPFNQFFDPFNEEDDQGNNDEEEDDEEENNEDSNEKGEKNL